MKAGLLLYHREQLIDFSMLIMKKLLLMVEDIMPGDGDGQTEPKPVPESAVSERVVVDPGPQWGDWDEIGRAHV